MIDFMRYKVFYFLISAIVILPGIVSLILYGVKPSIDFTGGSLLELEINQNKPVPTEEIRAALPQEPKVNQISSTSQNTFVLHTGTIDNKQAAAIKSKLSEKFGEVEEVRFETVGPTIGQELIKKTIAAILLASATITIYIMTRFRELKYGICAILAMFHDSLVVVGVFSLLGHFQNVEIDALFVTALLTILSFSVHDTIVVYDRIRETLRRYPKNDFTATVNQAVTQTLGRSLNNSLTIIFMLIALWLMGGDTTKWFIFALLIGTISGTYSSTFTAAPLLVIWEQVKKKSK